MREANGEKGFYLKSRLPIVQRLECYEEEDEMVQLGKGRDDSLVLLNS